MKKTCILATLAVAATAASTNAEEAMRKVPQIGIVDMDRIGTESAIGKAYNTRMQTLQGEIEAARSASQAKISKLDAEIKALQEGLDKQAAFLSEDGADKKRQEIKAKAREQQGVVDDATAEIEKMRQRAQNQANTLSEELQQKIRPHVRVVAQKRGLDILLDGRSAMSLNDSLDITTDVIAEVDQTERVADASAGAAAKAPARR
jgi:Skp family chaperone for outer membrane proteins